MKQNAANGLARFTGEVLDNGLPHDRDAEEIACGILLLNPSWADGAGLYDDHFHTPPAREVFNSIKRCKSNGTPADLPHIVGLLNDSEAFGARGVSVALAEMMNNAGTFASRFDEYVHRLKEQERRRRTKIAAMLVLKACDSRQATADLLSDAVAQFDVLANEGADSQQEFEICTSADLSQPADEPEWAIRETLILGQDAVIGGPSKCMKTSAGIELAVSAATGTPFIGMYDVPRPLRVLFMSAESGRESLRICAASVAESKGFDLAAIDNLLWSFEVPFFGHSEDIGRLRQALQRHKPELLVLDPTYRILAGDRAENLFIMGQQLGELSDVCRSEGATPILCHHTKKKPVRRIHADDFGRSAMGRIRPALSPVVAHLTTPRLRVW